MRRREHQWFRDAAFGMFIHWGLYAISARGEWVMHQEDIPVEEYAKLARTFNPKHADIEAWVKLAKSAGMQYMVLTTKHHDGFCLFDSKVTDFTTVKTAAGRDFVAEYVAACRKHNMRIGFYFSMPDWRWPVFFTGPDSDPAAWKAYVTFTHAQVRELCTNYGKIDILWYDHMAPRWTSDVHAAKDWQSKKMNAMVRKLQPHILINDRSELPEDFFTSEMSIRPPQDEDRLWEACMTMNTHWGYCRDDRDWKSAKKLVNELTATAAQGGNFLLNAGPRADGSIPAANARILKRIGEWVKVHRDAIHNMRRSDLYGGTYGMAAQKGGKTYLYAHFWPGRELVIVDAPEGFRTARILTTGEKARVEYRDHRLVISGLPAKAPDPLCTVIVLGE